MALSTLTHNSPMKPNCFRSLLLFAGVLPPLHFVFAQTDKEKAVELSPFVVNADADVGYLAGNTLAGSRMNTPLKDTAASLSVLTAEFLKDIGATDLTSALEWSNNTQLDRNDTAAFGSSANDNATFGSFPTFRIRGLPATVTRNYFTWTVQTDSYNLDRIEEARGPNSVLFGIGGAGGVVNASTKQPSLGRSFTRGSAAGGSYGGYRGTIDSNQALAKGRLAVRFNAVYDHSGGYRLFAFNNRRQAHLAAKFQLTPKTSVRAEYETGTTHGNVARFGNMQDKFLAWQAAGRPTFATPVAANNALGLGRNSTAARVTFIANDNLLLNMADQNVGNISQTVLYDKNIAGRTINTSGPDGAIRDAGFNATSVFLDHQIGANTFVEIAFNHQDSHLSGLMPFGDAGYWLAAEPMATYPNGAANPHAGGLFVESPWVRWRNSPRLDNTRISLSHDLDLRRWGKYRFAALAEHESRVSRSAIDYEVWEGRPFNSTPENAANQVFRRNYVTEGKWDTYYINSPSHGFIQNMTDPVSGRTLSSRWVAGAGEQDDPSYQDTLQFGGQARYWKDRVVLGFGFRRDKLRVNDRGQTRDPSTSEFVIDYVNSVENTYYGSTRTLGSVFHLSKAISVFYNNSNSFALPNLTRVFPDSKVATGPSSTGEDYGFALTLFQNRLYVRATRFDTAESRRAGGHGIAGSVGLPANFFSPILDALVSAGSITQPQADARRVDVNGMIFDRRSYGYELSITGNPTKNWRLSANYSYSDARESNVGVELLDWYAKEKDFIQQYNTALSTSRGGTIADTLAAWETLIDGQTAFEGIQIPGARPHKVNVFTRYSFSSGPLKNLFVGGGYRHQSKILTNRILPAPFKKVYGRSFWSSDAVIGYRTKVPLLNKPVNLQLNVSNLFDDTRPLILTYFAPATPEAANNTLINRYVIVEPRTWRLTADFEF
jgi:iron complex outermembrane recepter protein